MQLHIQFRGVQVDLPIAYRHTQQGFLYHALSGDAAFATQLHEEGRIAQARSFKLFTFSPFSGAYSVAGKRIIFRDTMCMEIRSTDEHFIRQVASAIAVGSTQQLAGNPVEVTGTRVTDEHLLMSKVKVQTLSPVVVYQTLEGNKTRFFSPEEPEFVAGIVRNAQRKWQSLHGEGAPFDLTVEVLTDAKPRKVATTFKGTFITGWNCRLRLTGAPEVLDMLYQTGLGAKSSQGFGMFRALKDG